MITDPAYNPAYSNFCYEIAVHARLDRVHGHAGDPDHGVRRPATTCRTASTRIARRRSRRSSAPPRPVHGSGRHVAAASGDRDHHLRQRDRGRLGLLGRRRLDDADRRDHRLQRGELLQRSSPPGRAQQPDGRRSWPTASPPGRASTGITASAGAGHRDAHGRRHRRRAERDGGHGQPDWDHRRRHACVRRWRQRRPGSMDLTITALGDKVVQNPPTPGPTRRPRRSTRRPSRGTMASVAGRNCPAGGKRWGQPSVDGVTLERHDDHRHRAALGSAQLRGPATRRSRLPSCGQLVITRSQRQEVDRHDHRDDRRQAADAT